MVHHHAITVTKVELSAVETTALRPGAVATLSAESRALRLIGIARLLGCVIGGALGLHHFYMGRRRAGIWYAALFWLAVPMLLGWIDAVRLALLTERQFQARIVPSLPVQS